MQVRALIFSAFPALCGYVLANSVSCATLTILRSTGRPAVTVYGNTAACLCIMLPLGYALSRVRGLSGLWLGMACCWCALAAGYLAVILQTDWRAQVIVVTLPSRPVSAAAAPVATAADDETPVRERRSDSAASASSVTTVESAGLPCVIDMDCPDTDGEGEADERARRGAAAAGPSATLRRLRGMFRFLSPRAHTAAVSPTSPVTPGGPGGASDGTDEEESQGTGQGSGSGRAGPRRGLLSRALRKLQKPFLKPHADALIPDDAPITVADYGSMQATSPAPTPAPPWTKIDG